MAYKFVREPLLAEEADKLCQACQTPIEKMAIWVLLDTGLRVAELCSLTPQSISWQQKTITVLGKGGPYGKQSKKRVVPLSPRARTLLEHYFSIHEKWPLKKRQTQNIIKQVADRARIAKPISAHVLRHTFAALSLQKGISLASVQKILGHDRLETTAIYLNFTDAHVLEEFQRKW